MSTNCKPLIDRRELSAVVLLICIVLRSINAATQAEESDSLGVIVSAGEADRLNTPVQVDLPESWKDVGEISLIEILGGNETEVPAQLSGTGPRTMHWILTGPTPQRSTRNFIILKRSPRAALGLTIERNDRFVEITRDAQVLMHYNLAHVDPPPGVDHKYGRSGHIHPVRTPGGLIVTDEFPPDHLHQDGLFLAYTKTEFQGRNPNFWDLLGGTGRVRAKFAAHEDAGAVFASFRAGHEHVDLTSQPESVALVENWAVTVWNVPTAATEQEASYYLLDITSSQRCNTDSPLKLLQYHYGGMALRGARSFTPDHCRFLTSEGKGRLDGNHTRPIWCDLTGDIDGKKGGLAIITHQDNFRYPEPLRIHPDMPYMVYTPSVLGDWEIAPKTEHVARYRFVIHDGELAAGLLDQLAKDFADPPVARIVESLPR